jgi:hypothetical protein
MALLDLVAVGRSCCPTSPSTCARRGWVRLFALLRVGKLGRAGGRRVMRTTSSRRGAPT